MILVFYICSDSLCADGSQQLVHHHGTCDKIDIDMHPTCAYTKEFLMFQEGFASEFPATAWLVRFYFIIFFVVMLVILQVVISFIVDEFKFKVLDTAKKRICPEHKKPFEHCHCKRCMLTGLDQVYMGNYLPLNTCTMRKCIHTSYIF